MGLPPAAKALRKIQPLALPADLPRAADFGAKPATEWVAPTDLYIDEVYQRDLTERSAGLIKRMVSGFHWSRMKPPIVVMVDGLRHVVDGQHTAIAAATLAIPKIPIVVVEAATLDKRAEAFVGHNTDRIIVPPLNIYRALLAAGHPDAVDVDNVCRRAGVRLRSLNNASAIAPGDTSAISSVRALVRRRGVMRARQVLEALVKGKRAPIAAAEIVAVEFILCTSTFKISIEDLARTIRVAGDSGFAAARGRAVTEKRALWRILVERWVPALKAAVQ